MKLPFRFGKTSEGFRVGQFTVPKESRPSIASVLLDFLTLGTWSGAMVRRRNSKFEQTAKAMELLMPQLGLQLKKTLLNSRAQASLQLAYRDVICLRFYDHHMDGVGIYELMSENMYVPFVTVYVHTLKYQSPHLYFDNKHNNSPLRHSFPENISRAQLVQYEAYVNDRYDLYAPPGYALDSLVVGAPDVLDAIDQLSLGADIEILGNQMYFIFPQQIKLEEIIEQLFANGTELAKQIDDNLSRYHDERAIAFNQPIGYSGRRLIKY